jgi:hypothetical protein
MDEIFLNPVQLNLFFQNNIRKMMPLNPIDEKTMAEQYKNMPKNMEQALAGMETLKQMSPDDLARLMKMGGHELTPEMMEKMKEIPEMLNLMEKRGTMKEMKRAMAAGKGFVEGLGDEGIDRLTRAQTKGFEQAKKQVEQPVQNVTAEGKTIDVESFFESPRNYKPLTRESGAVKVA